MVLRERDKEEEPTEENRKGKTEINDLTPEILADLIDDAICVIAGRGYFKQRKSEKFTKVTKAEMELACWMVAHRLSWLKG